MSRNPHHLLGVSPSATKAEIRSAYLRRMKVLHPDRFDKTKQAEEWKMANAMLAELNAAYELLTKGGAPIPPPNPTSPPPSSNSPPQRSESSAPPPSSPSKEPPKSRQSYITIAIFLGCFGIHNFYARRNDRGVLQLVFGALGLAGPAWFIVSAVWILIDILKVTTDGDGIPFSVGQNKIWHLSRLQWGAVAVGLLVWAVVASESIDRKPPSPAATPIKEPAISVSVPPPEQRPDGMLLNHPKLGPLRWNKTIGKWFPVTAIQQPPLTPAAPASPPQNIDQQALVWLAANPNDPRAEAVRKKLIERGVLPVEPPATSLAAPDALPTAPPPKATSVQIYKWGADENGTPGWILGPADDVPVSNGKNRSHPIGTKRNG